MKRSVIDIRHLSPRKRELFLRALEDVNKKPSAGGAIPKRTGPGPFPLSFAQERLWFIDQLQPNDAAYNAPGALRIEGKLDVRAMERAINEIIRRHESLRTVFQMSQEGPVQVIGDYEWQVLPMVDLEGLPDGVREQVGRKLTGEESRRPFELSRGPLVRVWLFRLGPAEQVIFYTLHHIISDGWSGGVMEHELGTLYEAFGEGKSSPLPELPVQYADFAVWQRGWLQGEVLEKQVSYWKKQLAGVKPLELATDHPRPAIQSSNAAEQEIKIDSATLEALKRLGAEQGVTLFMTLLAGFQVMLSRYSGQEDIVVGSPIANRTREEVEGLIGFFTNTLVMRTDLSGDPTVGELLQRVRKACLGAFEHQDLPFEILVKELQPERDLSRNPLFQVLFALQNTPKQDAQFTNLTFRPAGGVEEPTRFDLELHVWERSGELTGGYIYNTILFDRSTVERMATHLERVLEEMVKKPQGRLSELEMLSEEEREQILVDWNDTRREYPMDKCIHELFEEQAERSPESVAVVYEDQQLTYRELNEKANQLGHYLRRLGVGPEVLVGLCVERGLEMIVGLLGILKVGGAYVPLDPQYPEERLAFMLQDAQVKVLLTQERLVGLLPGYAGGIVCLDRDVEKIEQEDKGNWRNSVGADSAAYVIYTSGSTGQPKGAVVTHHNVVRLFQATQAWFEFGAHDVWTFFHSHAFDFSVWEIWGGLLCGGRVVVVPYLVSRAPQEFYEMLIREGVTVLNQTPSAFRQLMKAEESLEENGSLALRLVIFGGEALEMGSLRPWFERHGDRRPQLVNMYGITETTVHVTYRPIDTGDIDGGSVIGNPIPDLRAYILDRDGQLVPIGARGELYIGGAGVARGYLGRAELTAEKFVPDPFSKEGGDRLYRTGDLGRYVPDGDIEYLGRADQQVKIRGYRIELGEIENVMGTHPGIGETVVVAREDEPGEKRLVGYVVRKAGVEVTVEQLKVHLRGKLPGYMVPGVIMVLEKLPLTANGKVDRKSLPDVQEGYLSQEYEAPRNERERRLTAIWREVLRVERVGIHDNFFEMGGDSILSIQIIARAREAGIELTPRQIFERQTIGGLMEVAGSMKPVMVEEGKVHGEVGLTAIQRWFFEQELAQPNYFNQSVLLMVKPGLRAEVARQAVRELVKRHDVLRLKYEREEGGEWKQSCEMEEPEIFAEIDLDLGTEEERIERMEAVAWEVQGSLDLREGIMARAVWVRLGEKLGERLLMVIHHLAVDGVSWRILLEDLQRGIEQVLAGSAIELGARTTSYRQWERRLREYASEKEVKDELEYWKGTVKGDGWELPLDGDGDGENLVGQARTVSVWLEVGETEELLKKVPEKYHTEINDVLLTALVETFWQWTGRREVRVNLEGHGREDLFEGVDVTRTVGWFTTIYPVKLKVDAVSDVGGALKAVKEQLRKVPRRGIGYGLLRYVNGEEGLECGSEVSFNYLGQFDQVLETKGWFKLARENGGAAQSAQGRRAHVLDITGSIMGGRLRVNWTYGRGLHRQETIERVAQEYLRSLRKLIEHCRGEGAVWSGRPSGRKEIKFISRVSSLLNLLRRKG